MEQPKSVIIYDSGASLPHELRTDNDPYKREVYFQINHRDGNQTWEDSPYLDPEETVKMEDCLKVPGLLQTSQPATGSYIKAYLDPILNGARELTVIPMSSGLSQSINSAELAKSYVLETPLEELQALYGQDDPEMVEAIEAIRQYAQTVDIQIADSKSVSLVQGLEVLEALKMAKAGMPASEIKAAVEMMKDYFHVAEIVDNGEHLLKGGRIKGWENFAINALGIKPIIGLDKQTGKLTKLSKAMGNKKAERFVVDYILQNVGASAVRLAFTQYENEASMQRMVELSDLDAKSGESTVFAGSHEAPLISRQTNVLNVHVGPGSRAMGAMILDKINV